MIAATPKKQEKERETYHPDVRVVAKTRLADDGEIRALPPIGFDVAIHLSSLLTTQIHSKVLPPQIRKVQKSRGKTHEKGMRVSSPGFQLLRFLHTHNSTVSVAKSQSLFLVTQRNPTLVLNLYRAQGQGYSDLYTNAAQRTSTATPAATPRSDSNSAAEHPSAAT